MKLKAALVMMMLVLASMLSFSNRCGQTCDGRTMAKPVVEAATVSTGTAMDSEEEEALETKERAEAGNSALLRISIVL